MTSTFQRWLLVIFGAVAAAVLFAQPARADFGFPPPENLTTTQGIVRAIVVTLVVELAIVVYFCHKNRWSLPRFLIAGVVGNVLSLFLVWFATIAGFVFLAFFGFAVFVLAEFGAAAFEAQFYTWIGRQPFRSMFRLALVANLATMTLSVIDQAVHFRTKSGPPTRTVAIERTDYREPPREPDEVLTDDTLEGKNPAFDEDLVDSRPLGEWEVNASAAVIRLDCPPIKPDVEQSLLLLRRSYAEAIQQAPRDRHVLPSANLLDGAAKQFDDGLYAAVDLACYRGELGLPRAAPDLIRAAFTQLASGSPARPFLAAALELAGRTVPLQQEEETNKQSLLARCEADQARSKPIGFYQWTPELQQVWRFYRFLQKEFGQDELDPCRDVAAVLGADLELGKDYRGINGFYGRLTNPQIALPADALIGADGDLKTLAQQHGARHAAVSIFPSSTSRETELFDRLFPMGVPAGTNLMNTLICRIRSGEIDLKPGTEDGWY